MATSSEPPKRSGTGPFAPVDLVEANPRPAINGRSAGLGLLGVLVVSMLASFFAARAYGSGGCA